MVEELEVEDDEEKHKEEEVEEYGDEDKHKEEEVEVEEEG